MTHDHMSDAKTFVRLKIWSELSYFGCFAALGQWCLRFLLVLICDLKIILLLV